MAKTTNDPFEAWRQWIDKTERQMNAVMNEFMDSEAFGKTQGRAMESLLKLQASMNQATERYFSTINLATRTDLLTVSGQLTQIDERLASIESALRELGRGSESVKTDAGPRPKRTKKASARNSESESAKAPASRKKAKARAKKRAKKSAKKTARKTTRKTKS